MKTKLAEIAKIHTGFHLRGAMRDFAGDDMYLLRMVDIARVDGHELRHFDTEASGIAGIVPTPQSQVRYGDVLLTARGINKKSFKAVVYKADTQKDVFAGLSLFILRPHVDKVLPEYLALFLNSADGQKQLASMAEGMTVPAISRNRLMEEFTLELPSLSKQLAVVQYSQATEEYNRKLRRNILLQKQIISRLPNIII